MISIIRNVAGWMGAFLIVTACTGHSPGGEGAGSPVSFTLSDYYSRNAVLDSVTDLLISDMGPEALAGQMIVVAAGRLGKPSPYVDRQIAAGRVGGVLLLNGTVESFKKLRSRFDSVATRSGTLPLMYSADAEPSLINRKIVDSPEVPKTIELRSVVKSTGTGNKIANILRDIGIHQGYAPVVDISAANVAISDRSFGNNPDSIVMLAGAFVRALQENGIIATAKHFPGHGLVKGDSHSGLVYVDGSLKEISVYPVLIRNGVLSIMVGHIAVKNNDRWGTDGLPATCSGKIVTDLLKNELGFRGLVVTDAMNMGALSALQNAPLLAVRAGCDVILMPANEEKLVADIVKEMERDNEFRRRVEASARKIIRMKLCLGLLPARTRG